MGLLTGTLYPSGSLAVEAMALPEPSVICPIVTKSVGDPPRRRGLAVALRMV